MSENLIPIGAGVVELLFGFWLGWLRWGRGCPRPRHEWVERWVGFEVFSQCTRCGKVGP